MEDVDAQVEFLRGGARRRVPMRSYLEHAVQLPPGLGGGFRIDFTEEDHQYTVRGSQYAPEAVLSNRAEAQVSGAPLPLMVSTTTLLKKHFRPMDFATLAVRVYASLLRKPEEDWDPRYEGVRSPEDVQRAWGEGARLGTLMHWRFEALGNLLEYDRAMGSYMVGEYLKALDESPTEDRFHEAVYFERACRALGLDAGALRFARTEYSMFHPELLLCGMIDGLLQDSAGNFVIIDWKRCRGGLKRAPRNPRKATCLLSESSRGTGSAALCNLRNVSEVTYGLQLSIYRRFFERMHPTARVVGMYIVVVDSLRLGADDALQVHEVPLRLYDQAVDDIFAARAQELLASRGLPDAHRAALGAFIARGKA